MYTDKSVAQSMRAINERLHATGTKSRPQIDGWVEKSGNFAMSVTTTVRWKFKRKTFLQARAKRDGGFTVIQGNVPGGLSRDKQMLVIGIMIVIGLVLGITQSNVIMTIVLVLAGGALSIPFEGDYHNSEVLLTELQRALSAKFAPPKK
jgi:hypothetical protein